MLHGTQRTDTGTFWVASEFQVADQGSHAIAFIVQVDHEQTET